MRKYSHTIDTHFDFEFHCQQSRKTDYSICIPETFVEGVVVFVAGFGEDAGEYRENFQQYICKKFHMACLIVDYHCFYSRPNIGAQPVIELSVEKLLRSITGCVGGESIDFVISEANKIKVNPEIPLTIPGILIPKNNEYQNFGILPALDNLYALYDVFQRYPQITKKIFAIGSSYGGYIANLMAKFAPCTINAVFDNSSWAKPNLNYIIGYELGQPEYTTIFPPDIKLELNVLSPWSKYLYLPHSFTESRLMIRSFSEEHLDVMREVGKGKTVYCCVHAENDCIANTEEKVSLVKAMIQKEFNVQMEVYCDDDVDGEYIKNMEHGMGLSLRKFFSICHEHSNSFINNDRQTDFDFKHSFNYVCDTLTYKINYIGNAPPGCSVYQGKL